MKQKLILMIALSISVCITAQNREISGYILKDLTDIVKIEGNNVNLRKAPSASSPRLVSQVYDTDEIGDVIGKWSDEVKGKSEPIYGSDFRPCVQTGRNHNYGKYDDKPVNADLWVKLAYNVNGVYFPVWVKQNFCSIMPNGNITPDNYYSNNYEKYQLSIRKSGQYEGLCLYQSQIEDSMEDPEGLFVGMLVNGQVVLPLRFNGHINQDEDVKEIEINDSFICYPPSLEVQASYDGGGFMTFDMNRLTDNDITKILAQCEDATNSSQLVLLRNTFDGGFFRLSIPTDGSSFCGLPVERVKVSYQPTETSEEILTNSDTPPSFPGGMGVMMSWLGRNMKYPDAALSRNIQGRVMVKFIVMADGSIRDIQIVNSVDKSLDEEAIRLVKSMPKWTSGTRNGKAVNVWYTIPITFRLQ